MKFRAPGFMFYPPKWRSGTDRLSDKAYRAYMNVLCWMWDNAPDHCSMVDSVEAWEFATGLKGKTLQKVRVEIQHPVHPMLKKRRTKLVSLGLKKEAEKQKKRNTSCTNAANARWEKEKRRMRSHPERTTGDDDPQSFTGVVTDTIVDKEKRTKKSGDPVTGFAEIWGHWMELGIQDRNLIMSGDDAGAIRMAVESYSIAMLKDAMSMYAKILKGPEYLLTTRWSLAVFLNKQIGKFLPGSYPEESYGREKKKPVEKTKVLCPECSKKPDEYRKQCGACKGSGSIFR